MSVANEGSKDLEAYINSANPQKNTDLSQYPKG
jgi:hypothetical protein